MKNKRLLFIVGPTASGKTELALREAEARGAPILSCDSLCVYRGMDVGTAKPTPAERARVPHFGIDLCDPQTPFSVARYIAYRDRVLHQAAGENQELLVVGGSGFYLRSFFYPVVDELEIPGEVTQVVTAARKEGGLNALKKLLKDQNPRGEKFEGLDMSNERRVEKALLRCLVSGKSFSELLDEFKNLPEPLPDWTKEVRLVTRPRETLLERNRKRVRAMLGAGLVEEVRKLRALGFEGNPSACGAIGYREGLQYLDGKLTMMELEEAIYIHTNQLMRKQRTWFRRQIPVDHEVRL